jgi:hypothetical protein
MMNFTHIYRSSSTWITTKRLLAKMKYNFKENCHSYSYGQSLLLSKVMWIGTWFTPIEISLNYNSKVIAEIKEKIAEIIPNVVVFTPVKKIVIIELVNHLKQRSIKH